MMYDIVGILMNRDGVTEEEAKAQVNECRRRLQEEACESGDYDEACDIIAEELGLEPDYMIDLLF